MWEKIVLLVAFTSYVGGVLTGFQDNKDITKDHNFNCRWQGGMEAKLICSCLTRNEEFYIKNSSIEPYNVHTINISNCGKIRFGPNAISNMRSLREIELKSINSLILEENSFYWVGYTRSSEHLPDWDSGIPSLKITVEDTTVTQIASHAIKGRINQIVFNAVTIENIASFGFTSLEQTRELGFYSTRFKELLPQNFKKFSTEKLIIRDSIFDTVPSRTFYDVHVKNDFILDNVTIDTLKPSGFIVNNPRKFELVNSNINNLNGEAFRVMTRGHVLIKNNVFNSTGIGAFRAITLNKDEIADPQVITLEKDIFHKLSKDSLLIDDTSFEAKFVDLQLSEFCDCGSLVRYFKNVKDTSELKCRGKEMDWVTVEDYKTYNCSMLNTRIGTAAIIGISCLVLLVIIIIGLICFVKKLYRCGSYGDNDVDKTGKLSMIVPDGRTYRETELHVIVERADLLTTDL